MALYEDKNTGGFFSTRETSDEISIIVSGNTRYMYPRVAIQWPEGEKVKNEL